MCLHVQPPMSPPSAEQALTAPSDGRSEAPTLEALVALHGERAVRIASRIVRDRAAAEDIAQEAFAKAWRALPRFRGEAELSTWLYRVVVNEALSHLRRQKLRDRLLALLGPERPASAPPPAPDPTLRAAIRAALETLSDNERAVFTLIHLEGFPVEETARIRGRAVGTVKSQLHRALAKLRRELAPHWEEAP
jgi:RNA polymerase sigma-70 factor (ECF subfamily)